MTKIDYDELLHIDTSEKQEGFVQSIHYHRYEATPYEALTVLFENYQMKSTDHVVDFGCGKGRLAFYISAFIGASVVGVEMNERLYEDALRNKAAFLQEKKSDRGEVFFVKSLAEKYEITPLENRFYFFNPFTVQIFMKVVNRILDSMEAFPREVELVLYYVSQDYLYYLENHPSFILKQEIPIPNLYETNQNERFLIYQVDVG
ncbi:class I SAM-dependent methyltransferase [Metabacillus sp. HB246100]